MLSLMGSAKMDKAATMVVFHIYETCGISRRTAIYILNDLVEKKFLSKTEVIHNGVKRVLTKFAQCAEIAPEVVQKLHRGSAIFAPNNI